MAQLYDETERVIITDLVEVEQSQDVTKIQDFDLAGNFHIQIIGKPAISYNVNAYITRKGKSALETAEANGNLISVTVQRGTYYGTLSNLTMSRFSRDLWQARVTLAKED